MTDFYLETDAHDIEVVDGEFRLTTDEEFIVQRIKVNIMMYLGEWFLDTTLGLDYFDKIFTKGGNITQRAEREFRRVIQAVEGVSSINSLDITLDNATRKLDVKVSIIGDTGELSTLEVTI